MKTLIVALLLIPHFAFSGGFDCPKSHRRIELKSDGKAASILVLDMTHPDQPVQQSLPRLVFPGGDDIDSYQERWGAYNVLMANAQIQFPYMPEFLLVYHLVKSKKLYLDGFKQMDDLQSSRYVKLGALYCDALVAALEQY